MATQETKHLDAIVADRRTLLAFGGAALAGMALTAFSAKAYAATFTDTDILNFALNLEYLEAQFYTLAASGVTADDASLPNPIGTGAGITATGGATVLAKGNNAYKTCKVAFTLPLVQSYALEIAYEERNHVTFLRNALDTGAVAQPSLDLVSSFVTLGNKLSTPISNFDPFSNDANFLLGAYLFEDVGVSAYHGAATMIADKTNVLPPAAQIHAVEAYHAGLIRTTLLTDDAANGTNYATVASNISALRNKLDGSSTTDDVGLSTSAMVALQGTTATYRATTQINADANYLCWARTTAQVLNIVYAGGAGQGGFFPSGMNGNIK